MDINSIVDRATREDYYGTLEVQDPETAEEIKKLMFVFEDIVMIDEFIYSAGAKGS